MCRLAPKTANAPIAIRSTGGLPVTREGHCAPFPLHALLRPCARLPHSGPLLVVPVAPGDLVEPHVVPHVAGVRVGAAPERGVRHRAVLELVRLARVGVPAKRVTRQAGHVDELAAAEGLQRGLQLAVRQPRAQAHPARLLLRGCTAVRTACDLPLRAKLHHDAGLIERLGQARVLQEAVLPPLKTWPQVRHLADHLLEVEDVVHRAGEGQLEVRAGDDARVRCPPAVQATPQLRHHQRAAKRERDGNAVPHLQDLVVGEREVADGALDVHGGG
mmetsp:Transcript_20177/g.51664  ORF Transcript_20177/g.51664 Transcript_20177/m.51664 type:complete len:274 (-) Transcript_20177:955-1776(-)